MNDDFEAWAAKGSLGKPNWCGKKLNRIESGPHLETSVEFLPLPR
jgi:hypothetical protein